MVTVSPTRVSRTFLSDAVIYPTIPAESSSQGINCPGPKIPISTTSASAPVAIIRILSPFLTVPSISLIKTITPLYESYTESNISAFKGAFISPLGGGSLFTIASNTASMFIPFLADI